MKKFTFSLESLLTLREWEEHRAEQGLARANAEIDRLRSKLEALSASIDQAYQSWDGSDERRFTAMDRISLVASIEGISRRTEEARRELREAEQRRQKAMQGLVEASRNRKVVSNLKSTRRQAHVAEVERREAMEIEDIFNARRSVT